MKKVLILPCLILISLWSNSQTVFIPNAWINEIHYDDTGSDTLEGYEIAAPAGTDLSCYRVILYNGNGSSDYDTDTLTGIVPNTACGYGTVWFSLPQDGLQNGAPDGLVLEYAPTALGCPVNHVDTILQFLSYEGVITATGGRATGLTSTDIGLTESTNTPDTASLQLTGFGTSYADFTWTSGQPNTHNQQNVGQSFCPLAPSLKFAFSSESVAESIGTYSVTINISNPNANPTSVDVIVSGGTAGLSDYSFSTTTVTFPGGSTTSQTVTLNITNDLLDESDETLIFSLANPTNSATIGNPSNDTLTILDDDGLQISIYPHTLSQFENIGSVNVPVLLNNQSVNPTSVTVQLVSSTATPGLDFSFNDTTITWQAGTSGTLQVPVTIIDDNLFEADENILVKITNATNTAVIGDSTYLITILNNDQLSGNDCSDLYFSEYIEGSGGNKALEIYNPTNAAINLADYRLLRYTNGVTNPATFNLTGTLASDDVYVLAGTFSDSLLKLKADTLTSFVNHNGDDAYAFLHINDTIDVIGVLGVDPGTSWLVDTATTENHTLIRSYYAYIGNKNWNTAVESWKSYPSDLIDSLGFHNTAPCGTPIPSFPAIVRFVKIQDSVPEIFTPGWNYFDIAVECVNPSSQPANFTIAYDPAGSTAVQGLNQDFIYTNTSFTAGPGTTLDTFSVIINNDNLIEITENALFRFINTSSNVTIGSDSLYNLYITDSDVLTVSFLGASYDFPENSGTVAVKVVLSTPVANNTSVSVNLAAGSATRNVDYTYNDTTLTFVANSGDTLAFLVNILEDGLDEGNEEINFDLVNPTNGAVLGTNGCTVRIIDNDSIVGVQDAAEEIHLTIYPNPASNTLFIEAEADIQQLEVSDLSGQLLINTRMEPNKEKAIDLTSLSNGLYFATVYSDKGKYTLRFRKNQ